MNKAYSNELMLIVFSFLDFKDLSNCKVVDKRFNILANSVNVSYPEDANLVKIAFDRLTHRKLRYSKVLQRKKMLGLSLANKKAELILTPAKKINFNKYSHKTQTKTGRNFLGFIGLNNPDHIRLKLEVENLKNKISETEKKASIVYQMYLEETVNYLKSKLRYKNKYG